MANRFYLYSANKDLSKLRDLSEAPYEFPLFFKIILGVNTELSNSRIWGYEHPIAIKGNFSDGLTKLLTFFDYLKSQKLDQKLLSRYQKETTTFFEEHKDRINELFFMEGGEIYDMSGDTTPLEEQNKDLFDEIVSISKDVDEILAQKPADVFAFKNSGWLNDLKKDTSLLEVYWTHVTYFSFNQS